MKLLLAPFFMAFALNFFVSIPTYRTVDFYTDHLSHMMTVFLFAEHGFEIYRKDVKDLCAIKESSEITAFNERWSIPMMDLINTCQVHPGGRVLFINWPHMARPYPVGELLWYAPAAGLYAMTDNFPGVAQFMIWQMLLFAGIGMLLFLRTNFLAEKERRFEKVVWASLAAIALSTTAVMGFYDGLSFWLTCAAILSAFGATTAGGFRSAALLFAGACFFHYRAIWYFPVFLFAMEHWRRKDPGFWKTTSFAVCGLLLAVSVFTLATCLPSIQALARANPFLIMPGKAFLHFGPLMGLCAVLLWRDKNFAGILVLFSCIFFSATTPLAQRWYLLFWLPLLLITLRKGRGHQAFWGTIILLFALDQKIYDLSIFTGGALPTLIHGLFTGFLN